MREIVLDTETTGLDPLRGDRIVEIGCIELENHIPNGRVFHSYLNPECEVPEEVVRIHGLTGEFLRDHPVFSAVAGDFLDFIADAPLVIHNAPFDMGFLNAELARVKRPPLARERAIDTLDMARQKFPGARNSLDLLCKRFGIDNSARTKHGALIDCELLAAVYLEMIGGRQQGLALAATEKSKVETTATAAIRPPRPHHASDAERAAHEAFLRGVKNPIWQR